MRCVARSAAPNWGFDFPAAYQNHSRHGMTGLAGVHDKQGIAVMQSGATLAHVSMFTLMRAAVPGTAQRGVSWWCDACVLLFHHTTTRSSLGS